jgi:EAL domain-containing protein (putative c-di-GMP-specific phosphodiesterase class I)
MQPQPTTPTTPPPVLPSRGRVLVVDDERALRSAAARILEKTGYTVVQAADGDQAGVAIAIQRFDAIVSDICMPGVSGIQLLRRIRSVDADVPVLLVTGRPEIQTAIEAVELGALRYLVKPLSRNDLIKHVDEAVALGRVARMRREVTTAGGSTGKLFADRASMEANLSNAIATLWMAYQPIVNWKDRSVAAYEALVRSREPSLPNPGALLSVARRLDRLDELGRAIRAAIALDLSRHPRTADVYINLHPADLQDEALYSADAPLARFASQIVLEITERETLNPGLDAPACASRLRALGYRLAIDDLGSGYSGLSYFAQLTPDVAKIDMSLVRNIDTEEVKQKLVGSLVVLCKELGLSVVAEGVETVAERDTITKLGCDMLQGFLFAQPEKPFPVVRW